MPWTLRERLFMLLFYYRTYVTQILVGLVFGVGQATVSRDIANLEPTVKRCVPLPEKMHMAANKAKTIEDLEEIIPGLAVLIDASEQPIYRPQDDQTQKKYYSGKAKRHTMKTQYTTAYDGLIVHKSTPVEGSKHDFALFKQDNAAFPTDLPRSADTPQGCGGRTRTIDIGDSAYAGMQKQYPDRDVRVARQTKARPRTHARGKGVQQGALEDTNPRGAHDTPNQDIPGDGRQVQKPAS